MLKSLRARAHRALRSSIGDKLPPVRWTKDLLLFVNEMVGSPLSSGEEFAGRTEIERQRVQSTVHRIEVEVSPAERVPPVVIYTDGKCEHELGRIASVLRTRAIPYQALDVGEDRAAKRWLMARVPRQELPLVFIAGRPVGGYHELVRLSVSGQLSRMCRAAM